MAVIDELDSLSKLCSTGALKTLEAKLALGPEPQASSEALLWQQQTKRLEGQVNSLSALVSKLTAAAVLEGLKGLDGELKVIGEVSRRAEERIKQINEVSQLLTKLARVLDLGLAVLAVGAAPSVVTVTAMINAGKAVADEI